MRRDSRTRQEAADLVILNTCHIREKAADKVYSELGRVALDEAPARGRPEHDASWSPAASRRPKARRSSERRAARRRSGGRPAELSPPARTPLLRSKPTAAADGRHRVSGRATSSTRCRRPGPARTMRARRHRLRHGAGGLRQVLCLLRRALHTRRRGLAAGRAHHGRSARLAEAGVRETHADRPERQRLPWRGSGRPRMVWPLCAAAGACRATNRGRCAAALHHQPSQRHGRRPDRGASEPA
jgi:hypothetical protein